MTNTRLLLRLVRTTPGTVLLLAVVVALLAAVGTATPQVDRDLANRQLAHTLGGLSSAQGDVRGSWVSAGLDATARDTWDALARDAEEIRSHQPAPLRTLLGPAQFVSASAQALKFTPPTSTGFFRASLHLTVDPALRDHVTLVTGRWPRLPPAPGSGDPFDVVVLADTAHRMSWDVGTVLPNGFTVAGTYTVLDASDPRWQYIPAATDHGELSDPNLGVEVTMTVFAAPDAPPALGADYAIPMRTQLWFRLDARLVGGGTLDTALLDQQLTGLLADRHALGSHEVRLASDLGTPLGRVLGEQSRTASLLWLFTIGALLMGVALALLAGRLVHRRHRATWHLLTARGMSRRHQQRLMAVLGVGVGLPAAVLGQGLALWLLPGSGPPGVFLVVVGATALCVLSLMTDARSGAPAASDRAPQTSRSRWVWELSTALATAASLWLLLHAGARGPDPMGPGDFDPFVAVAPALVTLLGAVVVLRLLPTPLHWLARSLGRGRGTSGFIGVRRSVRSPAGGLLPVAVLVLGSSLGVISATLQGTLTQGVTDSAWSDNGAAVRLSGPRITVDLARTLSAIDGVARVAPLHDQGSTTLRPRDADPVRVHLWLADRSLLGAWAASPVVPPVPKSLFTDDGVPSVVVGNVPPGVEGLVQVDGLGPARVEARWKQLPGVSTRSAWVLGSVGDVPAEEVVPATVALLGLDADADPEAVRRSALALINSGVVTTVSQRLATTRDSPTTSGLGAITLGLTVVSVAFMVGALSIGQVIGADERRRTLVRLRSLGLSPRQAGAVTAWELAPVAIIAVTSGTALGIGIAALVVGTVDLTMVTGGQGAPRLYVDPVLVGAVVAATLVALGLTIAIGTRAATRGAVASPPEGDA